ncbi:MAG: (Fe-S)-binding protein [Caldisericia bacterium]|nr:(Fe-S)-binding protein [Caldisericia bacterium]
MPVPIGNTLGIFSDNIVRRRSILPLSTKRITHWSNGFSLPHGGSTILYTGQMYQLIPFINSMSHQLGKFEDSWITRFFGIGRFFNKMLNLTKFMAFPSSKEKAAYDQPIRNIVECLHKAGSEFGYLYEHDYYSGALAYDEGLDDAFKRHAKFVYNVWKEHNVKTLITIDPHTTNIVRSIYPHYIEDFDIEVKNYMEILAENPPPVVQHLHETVTVHDPCLYARSESIVEQPRKLLRNIGIEVQETELSGALANCCGGPLESLFPKKSLLIAKKRVDQLLDCASTIITSCPICMANLKRVTPETHSVHDISEYLVKSYSPDFK